MSDFQNFDVGILQLEWYKHMKFRFSIKFDQRESAMENSNPMSDFQHFDVVILQPEWYQHMKFRFSIKFDRRESNMGNPNLMLVFDENHVLLSLVKFTI